VPGDRAEHRAAQPQRPDLHVCAQLPALSAAADGYQAYVAVDACGRFEPQPSVATVSRLTQANVALANTRVIVLEAMADNAHPKANDIYATLPAGLVVMEDDDTA